MIRFTIPPTNDSSPGANTSRGYVWVINISCLPVRQSHEIPISPPFCGIDAGKDHRVYGIVSSEEGLARVVSERDALRWNLQKSKIKDQTTNFRSDYKLQRTLKCADTGIASPRCRSSRICEKRRVSTRNAIFSKKILVKVDSLAAPTAARTRRPWGSRSPRCPRTWRCRLEMSWW